MKEVDCVFCVCKVVCLRLLCHLQRSCRVGRTGVPTWRSRAREQVAMVAEWWSPTSALRAALGRLRLASALWMLSG